MYSCTSCGEDADNAWSIECISCQKWTHFSCVKLTTSLIKCWKAREMQFYCYRCCSLPNGDFDFYKSLKRLELESANNAKLILAADNEKLLLKTYGIDAPEMATTTYTNLRSDEVSKKLLEVFHPIISKDVTPLATVGDGNCMFRAVSLAMTGTQNHHLQLRLLCAIEVITNRSYYDTQHRKYVDLIKDNRVFVGTYENIVKSAVCIKSYVDIAHVYALSAALSKPINSYYPPLISETFFSDPFSRKIAGRNVNVSACACATLMWTQTIVPQTCEDFKPNHFVPLVKKHKTPGVFVDLTECVVDQVNEKLQCLNTSKHVHINDFSFDSSPRREISQDSDSVNSSDCLSESDSDESECNDVGQIGTSPQPNVVLSFSESECQVPQTNQPVSNEKYSCGDLKDGSFLTTENIHSLLTSDSSNPLESIPKGLKENKFYLVKNNNNNQRRDINKKSCFSDDCGVWDGNSGASPKTFYLIDGLGNLKRLFTRKGVHGTEKVVKGKREFTPLNPQPHTSSLVAIHRYYTHLKASKDFKKRVSWLGGDDQMQLAVVEYSGTFPGLVEHGNSKSSEKYTRTDTEVMTEIGHMAQTMKPSVVYNKLNLKFDELSAPRNARQIRDKKRNDKKQATTNSLRPHVYRRNIADHFIQLQNMIHEGHPFVRQMVHSNSKAPCLTLYSDEQLEDIKRLCCSGLTIWGIDKTFNLCDMHVTATCFKQLTVRRADTCEPPLFIGPIFIHDNSDFETYGQFFSHLKIKLNGTDTSRLIIGTDDEQAMRKAIKAVFTDSTNVLCFRHIFQNVNSKLKNDIGLSKVERNGLLDTLFGEQGLVDADDSITFDDRAEEFQTLCQSTAPTFIPYFQRRLRPLLLDRIHDGKDGRFDKSWTNNNSESVNHILKHSVDWKSKPLVDFIQGVETVTQNQYKDLRRALIATGQFRLADTHRKFSTDRIAWAGMTGDEKTKLYKKFRDYNPNIAKKITSTCGQSTFNAPRTLGKKIGQIKRKKAEKTRSLSKKVKV